MNTSPDKFDLCVFGCGPGGFAAAMRALDRGKHVLIVEKDEIGGAGVKWGALGSKTMWELAKDYAIASRVDRGYRASGLFVDFPAVIDTVLRAVKEKQYQMLSQIESFSKRRWKGPGSLTLVRGKGYFRNESAACVETENGNHIEIHADHFLIATGSTPRHFPHIEVDGTQIFDSNDILNLKKFPERLMIIGAGIIGCEYATIFSNFGKTKVFLVDNRERVIPFEDEDISDFVSTNLERIGVTIFHSAALKDIVKRKNHLEVILDFEDGRSEIVEVDGVLISIGRCPNLGGLDLPKAGIFPNDRGYLDVDASCRVKSNIFAAGDVTNHPALVNLAELEGRHSVDAMFGANRNVLSYKNMSTIMFFDPAVAAVGMNEKMCRKKGIPFKVAWYSNALVNRAIMKRALSGFVKIIIRDNEEGRILGMRASGPHVSSTVMSVALFMDQGGGIREALKSLYPHPTISEGIQECLRLLIGESVYKPHAFPALLKIRTWHPEKGYSL